MQLTYKNRQQTNLQDYSSVSGSSGYDRASDTITINNTGAASYANQNFGDARLKLVLTQSGQQTITAGVVADYPHTLQAQSVMTLTALNPAVNSQPTASTGQIWQNLIYNDPNCNGKVDAGETLLANNLPLTLLPNTRTCIVQRVLAPANSSAGAQNFSQLQANYSVGLANPAQTINASSNQQADTTLIGSAGLDMAKAVRVVNTCPSTAADTAAFSTNNKAAAGNYLEYEITYRNNSTKNLVDVKLRDSVPFGTIYKSSTCNSVPNAMSCNATQTNDSLLWQMTGTLPPAVSGKVRFCVQVPQ